LAKLMALEMDNMSSLNINATAIWDDSGAYGDGSGSCCGCGSVFGSGDGYGSDSDSGERSGYGSGEGYGYCSVEGSGEGSGDGCGYCSGSGDGEGYSNFDVTGNG